ncbi:hypothetical protein VVR12_10185 [Rothia sp. LK2588]|uniref:hypothetical protein n=1 Tax=Rothia sp. LK2588 TaxID=3114369 RepID=UPI0034CE7DC8
MAFSKRYNAKSPFARGLVLLSTTTVVVAGSVISAPGAYAAPGDSTLTVDGVNVIESGTTQADAQKTVNGKVVHRLGGVLTDYAGAGQTHPTTTPLEGVRVYAQWYERDGATSPIYTAVSDATGDYHIVMFAARRRKNS